MEHEPVTTYSAAFNLADHERDRAWREFNNFLAWVAEGRVFPQSVVAGEVPGALGAPCHT